jgi:hypothetical protein
MEVPTLPYWYGKLRSSKDILSGGCLSIHRWDIVGEINGLIARLQSCCRQ